MKRLARQITAYILILCMMLTSSMAVFADENLSEPQEETAEEQVQEKKEEPEEKPAPAAEPQEQKTQEAVQEAPQETPAPQPAEEAVSAPEEEQAAPEESAEEPAQEEAEPVKKTVKSVKSVKTKKLKLNAELTDGTYKPDSFEFSGGTGKTKVTCDEVIIKDGKATAVFATNSDNMTHFYMGEVTSNAENKALYDPSTGKCGTDVYAINDKKAYVPVTLNEKKPFSGRTTAMSEPHWIKYSYTLTLNAQSDKTSDDTTVPDTQPSEPEKQDDGSGQTALSNGTYSPEAFGFTGGTGKAKVTCEKVIIKNGKATAVFVSSSDYMTHFYMGSVSGDAEDKSLYDPSTGKTGQNVYAISEKMAYVPVTLNEEKPFAARTTIMSEPHWVQYQYKITLTEAAQKISDDTTIPGQEDEEPEPQKEDEKKEEEKDKESEEKVEPSEKKTLKDGTYKVKATTDRKMFYLYPKETNPAEIILVKKNGKMTATITLTGEGYDYVYMGTPAQAKKAGKSKWIKAKIVNGYYTFTIPVAELDKKLPITPHSSKYESDGDPSTDPWRPDKWIIIYSKDAKKVKDGAAINTKKKKSTEKKNPTSGKQTKFKNDKKAAKESKYKDDSGKSTSAVNNSTGLKDGVYTPDRFSWSGGSGRLSYIRCNKITVRGGKAYATIEFGSSKYDSLKASGHVYSKSGGGNSKFTIPVKLNANNTIIGRTTAMSMPHWVKYTIFIYKKGADTKNGNAKNGTSDEGDDGHLTSTKKLSKNAPDLMGLEFKEEVKVEHAKYFKIYKYEQGITLVEIDQASDTALYEKEKKEDKAADSEKQDDTQGNVEYDEEGNIIARSQNEITDDLYHNNIVNYLIVPDGVEIPAGLDKDCIIVQKPVKSGYIASEAVLEDMDELGVLDTVTSLGMNENDVKNETLKQAISEEKVKALGDYNEPEYGPIIKAKTDLAIFPGNVLPEEVKDEKDEAAAAESEEKKKIIETLQRRFSALTVPMLVDRSDDEADTYAEAEWIKVYGVIYGQEEKAMQAFEKYTKENKKKALKES